MLNMVSMYSRKLQILQSEYKVNKVETNQKCFTYKKLQIKNFFMHNYFALTCQKEKNNGLKLKTSLSHLYLSQKCV